MLTAITLLLVILFHPPLAKAQQWTFEETFTANPTSPSQTLLPRTFDYVVTHRRDSGGILIDHVFDTFPADHSMANCEVDLSSLSHQHAVRSSHLSNGTNPDQSFFMCKDHMMSSIGHIAGYSVTTFYPRQEFDFSDGGILEWDVNINDQHSRNWYEVMISPRDQLKVGAAIDWLPIDETYPRDRIVFQFGLLGGDSKRSMHVGTGQLSPNGIIAEASDWQTWRQEYPSDPALTDRRIRRKNRITITNSQIIWSIQKADGSFDDMVMNVALSSLPMKRGIVSFKSHAYTPDKDYVHRLHTFHWDNIRFDGPQVGRYDIYFANQVVKLHANGDVPVGTTQTVTVNLPRVPVNPKLSGQIESPSRGQVSVSINGRPDIMIDPIDYGSGCYSAGWKSFVVNIDPTWLRQGENTLKWTVGMRNCPDAWINQGYAIKSLGIQSDVVTSIAPTPTPTAQPTIPGDANGDGRVTLADLAIWVNNYLQPNRGISGGNFNSDTKVDGLDYVIWVRNAQTP